MLKMNRLLVFVFLLLVSCDYFEKKKVKKDDIVLQELETIDWNSVDEYPSFSICDSVAEKIDRKHCFESTILNHVNSYLAKQIIVVSEDVEDRVSVKLVINSKGEISILDIKAKQETLEAIPQIDSFSKESIEKLPEIYPALKRGQQVTTEFVLPVVVSNK